MRWLPTLLLLASCGWDGDLAGTRRLPGGWAHPVADTAETGDTDADTDTDVDSDTDADCGFTYEAQFGRPWPPGLRRSPMAGGWDRPAEPGVDAIAWAEPAPEGVFQLPLVRPLPDLTMPGYDDDMPLFERASAWNGAERCFETPLGTSWLTEAEAWSLYVDLGELTTGVAMDTTSGHRTVLGIRGAWPGTFAWHGNDPDVFNDTLVLLWQDDTGRHVREYPVNTDTGAYDFGYHSSSSLRPNRRYRYENGWHRSYNALAIDESGYRVMDDANHNGHWDSDRNGWLAPYDDEDHARTGSGHNIHMASVDAPLGTAQVQNWSAGCQTIPGMDNWAAFITDAWEGEGTAVDYFLVDVRDIAPETWADCTPDGTHACPFRIEGFPFTDSRTTTGVATRAFDVYNCSTADEGGAEVVYVLTVDTSGTLSVDVDCTDPVDIDVHLLEGDDPDACLARDHTDFTYDLTPGRYLVVADTWVDDGGDERDGAFTLRVDFD